MSAAAALLLLLAPIVREPVGIAGADHRDDPFQRRIAGLMVGEAVQVGFLTIVPLTARMPSEAGFGQADLPAWHDGRVTAVAIGGQERPYARLVNAGPRAVLVPAGTVLRADGSEVILERDAVVPAGFSALCPVRESALRALPEGVLRPGACLAPLPAGLLLHENVSLTAAIIERWASMLRVGGYVEASEEADVDRIVQRARPRLQESTEAFRGTLVGAVFLVGGEIAGAHVFASEELYLAALPDLLRGAALQAWTTEQATGNPGSAAWRELQQRTRLVDARGRALAWLRAMLDSEERWAESWGEGFDLVLRQHEEHSVGHGVLDHRRRLVHASFSWLGAYLQPARGAPPRRGPNPPPAVGGSETPPGQVDRKARPTLAEQRQRDRRPGPPGTGGQAPR